MIKFKSLNRSKDFLKILKKRKINAKYFTIYFDKDSKDFNKYLNISFVMKKNIGNAVKRNKIKRKLKYAIQKIYKETNLYYAMVFPVLIVFYSIFQDYTYAVENNDWSLVTFGHFIRYGCGIYFFYYCMFKINK